MGEILARTNRLGDPCPDWCAQTHDELLIEGKPEFGYMDGHASDPMAGGLGLRAEVTVRRYGPASEAPATVDVARYTLPVLSMAPGKASVLADLLDSLPARSDVGRFAGQLRAAAALAGAAE